jgi:hypothetical protein
MAFTQLTADLNNVQRLDNYPPDDAGMTPALLKATFDKGPNDIKTYINDTLLSEISQAIGTLGAAGLGIGGAYSAATTYPARTIVTYNGFAYVTLKQVTGVTPTNDNTNYVLLVGPGGVATFKGRQGAVVPASGDYNMAQVGGSNRNLLINWDFRNPVNQRGQSSYTGAGYTIDRWRLASTTYGACTISIDSDGVTITAGASTTTVADIFIQKLDIDPLPYIGRYLTMAFDVGAYAGTWNLRVRYSNSGAYISQGVVTVNTTGVIQVSAAIPANCNAVEIAVQSVSIVAGNYIKLKAAKVEHGTASTLANDMPADYGEQLALCQRRLIKIPGTLSYLPAVYRTTSNVGVIVPVPVTMGANPSFASGSFVVYKAGVEQTGFVFTSATAYAGFLHCVLTKSSHGITSSDVITVSLADVVFSADL